MKKNLLLVTALFAASSSVILQAEQEEKTVVLVKANEPGFEDRQFEKKKLIAAENIDKWLTAMLALSGALQFSHDWKLNIITPNINPFGFKLTDHNGKLTTALLLAKLGMTVRRMHLHNRYVGFNPFYMIPSMAYFMVVDMASWTWK